MSQHIVTKRQARDLQDVSGADPVQPTPLTLPSRLLKLLQRSFYNLFIAGVYHYSINYTNAGVLFLSIKLKIILL